MYNSISDKHWQTSQRKILISNKTLVMAILNVTPDSFSDGGEFNSLNNALKQTETFIQNGADIIDVGGESTRPNSDRVSDDEEIKRVIPTIKAIKDHFDIPISIDTSKHTVAEKAVDAGAEIINDISGLRFDEKIGEVAAKYKTGLVLMHLRGQFETMHKQSSIKNIIQEVSSGFAESLKKANEFGILDNAICLDIGIGFSKTFEQNLEIIAKLKTLSKEFDSYPMLVGTSRKSFIGKILDDASPKKRSNGTLATNVLSAWNGADIVRVHDVKETVEALKVADMIKTFAK